MMNLFRKQKIYIMPMAVLCMAFLAYMILCREGIFLFSGDSYEQVYQFYAGGVTHFFSGELFSYDFSTAFGQNPFYHSYYFLFSPFFYLSLLFPKSLLEYSFLFTTILKLAALYAGTVIWLKKLSKNDLFIVSFALLFTFSGWVFFYSNYIFFLDHLFVLPLLLGGIEDYLVEDKRFRIVFASAYIAVANYYFAYLFLAISCFYGLCRALVMKLNLIKKITGYLLEVVLGLALAAVVFLPNIYIILNSPRLGADFDFSMMSKYDIFRFVSGFFLPTTFRYDSSLLISEQWTRYLGWGNGVNAYMGMLSVYCLCLFLFSKKTKALLFYFGFFALGFVFYLFPVFSLMFQGTMDTRWFLYFHVFIVLIASELFEQKVRPLSGIAAGGLCIAGMAGLLAASRHFQLVDAESLKQCALIFGTCSFMIVLYVLIFSANRKKLLIWMVCLEVIFSGWCFFLNNETLTSDAFLDEFTDETIYEMYDDGSFYRILQDGYDYWPSNNAYAKNIRGVSFYSSIYNSEMEDYLARFKTTWSMPVAPGMDLAYSLVSAKYWVTKAYNYSEPYGYTFVESTDFYDIYENEHFVELGFGSEQTLNSSALENLSYLMQDLLMQKYLITETSENMEYVVEGLTEGYQISIDSEGWLYASPDGKDKAISDTILVIENLNSNDVTVELYFYGTLMNSYTYHERPYFSIPLSETDYVTDIRIVNLVDSEADIKTYFIDTDYLDESYQKQKACGFYDTEVTSNTVKGSISLEEKMIVYMSVPYDEGWTVMVDGHKVDYEKVNLGFIGMMVDEGHHMIEMYYEVPMLKAGSFISVCAVLILVILIKRYRMKKR